MFVLFLCVDTSLYYINNITMNKIKSKYLNKCNNNSMSNILK